MARRARLAWHEEALNAKGLRAVGRLAPVAKAFYLGGGTALALRLGHRVSLDLDLFSRDNPLGAAEREKLISALRQSGPVDVRESSDGTLHLVLGGTRVSLLRYAYPMLAKTDDWRGIRVAALEDLAAMKVSAIIGRGSRRDFLDLYAVATLKGLDWVLVAAGRKFRDHGDLALHAAKALVYFEDAEKEPPPRQITRVAWSAVRKYFELRIPGAVARLLR